MRRNTVFKSADYLFGLSLLPAIFLKKVISKSTPENFVPKRVLFVKLCCFGDSILLLPALSGFKKKYPEAKITVLASARNSAIFERVNVVDNVISLPISGISGAKELLKIIDIVKLFMKIKGEKFDTIINSDLYYRFTSIIPLLTRSSYSATFQTANSICSAYKFTANYIEHGVAEWSQFFALIRPLGIVEQRILPDFKLNISDTNRAEELLGERDGELLVGLMPGVSPNWPEKKWPIKYFIELISLLSAKRKIIFYCFGSKSESSLADQIREPFNSAIVKSVSGKTAFGPLAALISKMDLFISGDTGPMHLAAALNVPTIAIYGPTDPIQWQPIGAVTVIKINNCIKQPCFKMSSMPKCLNHECLSELSAELVADAADRILQERV